MAGMSASTAFLDNVDCEATSSSTLSSSLSLERVGISATKLDYVVQQDAASCGTINLDDGSTAVPMQLKSVSSDGVLYCSAFEDNTGDAAISDGLSCDKVFCNLMNANTERGKNLTVTRGTKATEFCAICHDKIKAEETAEIKGCEHSYCVTCILRWASYKAEPWCPQCRLPFSFLYVYRALDGTLRDYLYEESVCLLLRAFWFKPLVFQEQEEQEDYQDDYDAYEENYYPSNVRLGNRRWGDSGYVRAGRREARPVVTRQIVESAGGMGSSSRQAKGKEHVKEAVGRRARRAQKREQLDKMSGKK